MRSHFERLKVLEIAYYTKISLSKSLILPKWENIENLVPVLGYNLVRFNLVRRKKMSREAEIHFQGYERPNNKQY